MISTAVIGDLGFDSRTAEIEEMMKAGVFYGRKKSKTCPLMKEYIFATRNGVELIEPEATLGALERAGEFLRERIKNGATVLFVATQPAAAKPISELARKFGFPYVVSRWLGGFLTNFKTISKRIAYWKKLEANRDGGKFADRPKKELLKIGEEIKKLEETFNGVSDMERLPDVLFVVNINLHETAVREAKRLKVPIVAVISTDSDPRGIDYFIPANDSAASSINWILGKIEKFIAEGKAARDELKEKEEEIKKEEKEEVV